MSITKRIDAITLVTADRFQAAPPAPKSVKIELTGRCNYRCGAAERALAEMLPFIRAKKDEALVALEFRKTFRPQFGDRSRLGDDVVAGRMAMMYRLQEMRKEKRTASLVAYA